MDKIAFCFLVTQPQAHEEVWYRYPISQPGYYSIYSHCDKNHSIGWLESFRIPERIPTSWNDHFDAWLALIRYALSDPDNYKIVFVSEWCIPIQPFRELRTLLVSDDYSYFATKPFKKNIWVNGVRARKNNEWCILCREHAKYLLDDPKKILQGVRKNRFTRHPNEYVESTMLCGAGFENIHSYHLTYTWWNRHQGKHPFTFRSVDKRFWHHVGLALNSGKFFMRKVSKNIKDEAIISMVDSPSKIERKGLKNENCIQRNWVWVRQQRRHTKRFSDGDGSG